MNKHLVDFFEDELKTNNYYQGIRDFQVARNLTDKEILSDIVNEYDDHIDVFGPYRFVDAIEDYIDDDSFRIEEYETLYDVIEAMWSKDFFENY